MPKGEGFFSVTSSLRIYIEIKSEGFKARSVCPENSAWSLGKGAGDQAIQRTQYFWRVHKMGTKIIFFHGIFLSTQKVNEILIKVVLAKIL